MTVEEFEKDFEDALYSALNVNKLRSPYKTGNLRYNGIQIVKTVSGYRIYVDETAAPYAKYLDGKPSIQQRYPEGWWAHICNAIIVELMGKYDEKAYDENKEHFNKVKELRDSKGSEMAMDSHKSAPQVMYGDKTATGTTLNVLKDQLVQALKSYAKVSKGG